MCTSVLVLLVHASLPRAFDPVGNSPSVFRVDNMVKKDRGSCCAGTKAGR